MNKREYSVTAANGLPGLYCAPGYEVQCESIGGRWGLERHPQPAEQGLELVYDGRLALVSRDKKAPGPVFVDFIGGAVGHRRRFGGGKGQLIAKAAGFKGGEAPTVLDATAGLGRDAFVLAGLGAEVALIERSPVVAALLDDGMSRAVADQETALIVGRMRLLFGDAAQLMAAWQGERPDVVYLDPMFPPREKSARVKKEMQLFHQLLGHDPGADELLTPALELAGKRVVVKRPPAAPPLEGPEPTVQLKGKSQRFDVYVIKALRP